ncbi:hypothetical protein BJF92_18720 [Rhizobium rhizosphaerae]|uniref:HTH araC/xylS-type domain-containing protein n=1 Tax=Xaviernesmea rhizosphaerae TaxID=1672749 RepID=A0A1Q9ADR8_9HYPH|nr:AraC family transcriptional regulator [Xaviernesmea rhizosphaerae]OLP53065.1 hypothetical protein BJF92_18720 [Xaviernesmea rhizosphaerae]
MDKRGAGGASVPECSRLSAGGIGIARMRYDGDDLAMAEPSRPSDAFHVITQLADFRMHRLWRDGRLVYEGGHGQGALAITDLGAAWQCHHLAPFDNVRFDIPVAELRRFAEEMGQPRLTGLGEVSAEADPVAAGLAQALLPSLERPEEASPLFVEQVVLALMTHLAQAHGGLHLPAQGKGMLAAWQQKRATEFLAGHIATPFQIAELAQACGLSRNHFIKAFKQTFHRTPYRWLIDYRVSRARELLAGPLPIAEIAVMTGFSDQSHLTRVFSAASGLSPGQFRRQHRG